MVPAMILSDRTIREELAAGRITIDPLDESCIQPSSVDLRLDRSFRVFLNHTMPVIDVKQDLGDLTRLVEIGEDDTFILHPGEFVLASTFERVALPDDLVARIEGKSSLGRLGLLIHSSLPASEPLLVLEADGLCLRTIGEIVKQQTPCRIVAFDPLSFEVGYHDVTGWYEGPPDRLFEVRLASGRTVRVTAAHNLFTLSVAGEILRVRTAEVQPGTMVAVARQIPEPPVVANMLNVLNVVPEAERARLAVEGPSVARAFAERSNELSVLLREAGYRAVSYYRRRARLPWSVAVQVPALLDGLAPTDRVGRHAERHSLPARITIDKDVAWLIGMYVAEGSRRVGQVTISNTDQRRLDRLQATFARLGLPVYRSAGAVTCCSGLVSDLMGWLGIGSKAHTKRVPFLAFGWSDQILRSFLDGVVDGDGPVTDHRTSIWTTSRELVSDLLVVFARLGHRAACRCQPTANLPLWQVYAPYNEYKLLTSVPLPDELLRRARIETGLTQEAVAAGHRHLSDLDTIERRTGEDAVHVATLRRLRTVYSDNGAEPTTVAKIDRLVEGGLAWDRVVEVVDTGIDEAVYDIEVRPGGHRIENFLAGSGGVFVSNTAGFIDAGFEGHITLELSNVASLPITLYPGMKIGQLSFMQMTTPAEHPYGSGAAGSKYQGQRGPTPSQYFKNFE